MEITCGHSGVPLARRVKIHHIKIWPDFYEAVRSGEKTFELRVNDRGYQKGDRVQMNWFNPSTSESRANDAYPLLICDIGYVLPVDEKRVIFSLLNKREVPF